MINNLVKFALAPLVAVTCATAFAADAHADTRPALIPAPVKIGWKEGVMGKAHAEMTGAEFCDGKEPPSLAVQVGTG